jgi:RNA polymerase sigma-70 factor, ECF subfamily
VHIDAIDEQIRACLNRNLYESAFDLIVTHFSDKIMHLTYSIVSNDVFVEDVVQDVLLRVWRGLPAYRGEASVSTWIYSITRNTCLTALRRVGHKNSLSIEEPAVRMETESLLSPQQSAPLWDLPRLLSSLPDKQRQVLMLFYLEDKSYAEVALLLDLPVGTIKTYLHRGRKTIASLLQKKKGTDVS